MLMLKGEKCAYQIIFSINSKGGDCFSIVVIDVKSVSLVVIDVKKMLELVVVWLSILQSSYLVA